MPLTPPADRRTAAPLVGGCGVACYLAGAALLAPTAVAAGPGGTLTIEAREEADDSPTVTRMELRPRNRKTRGPMSVRRTVPAGVGVVLDRSLELALPEGPYQFRMIRGPEYRVVTGHFVLEKTSLDSHTVRLPRMVDMLAKGWTSGDCLVPPSPHSLPLRMASEDLHVVATTETPDPNPVPGRKRNEPIEFDPCWIRTDADHEGGLVFYGGSPAAGPETDLPVARLARLARNGGQTRVGIENPFAWALPVWLASERIDGMFVLGDWLRLDREVSTVPSGRGPEQPGPGDGLEVGYWAEKIYWNLLEAGFRLPPLAGSGSAGAATPVGYNRLYVGLPNEDYRDGPAREAHRVATEEQWWAAAWNGHSIATNGPLLRPAVGGKIPGHVFTARDGERLELAVELNLSVRDPVDYLEVVHNGRVHYSARLDEFARSGGKIPPVKAEESGWVLVRIVTEFPDHFRAATSAPWYIEFDGAPRITSEAVAFFRRWLADYEERLKRLPPERLEPHVPYVRAARSFWQARADRATVTSRRPGR